MLQGKGLRVGGGPGLVWLRLLCGFGFAGVGLRELAAEALDAASGVDQLLLAGKVRVAGRTDFDDDVALVRGASLKGGSAGALDVDVFVLRVNSLFRHGNYPFPDLYACRRADRLQR